MKAIDQARLEWVTTHLKLAHYVYTLAERGDATAEGLRRSIWNRAHLTETQIRFARRHIRETLPDADLDESDSVINEAANA